MAYDGMYGDLSTRGTTNEILAQVLEVQNQVLVSEANVEALEESASNAAVAATGAAAQSAIDSANSSSFAASAGLSAGNAANSAAAAAQSAIDAATNSAAALVVANDALTVANTANSTANAASATANAIAGTANTALANSNTAVITANAADATANAIAGTANTALTNSNTAISTANAASTTAGNAVTTANGAVTTANTANSTANAASTAASNAQTTANAALPKAGGKMTGAIDESNIVTVVSVAVPDIGVASSNTINISGTTNITGFASATSGISRTLIFSGVLTLTHNATSLILPKGLNITTAVGDVLRFVSLGSGNWRCVGALRASDSTWGNITGTLSNQTDLQTALDGKSSLGIGQTWQNVIGSRALGTTYTNSTGKPIMVLMSAIASTSNQTSIVVVVGGLSIVVASCSESNGSTWNGLNNPISFIVPAGSTYSINNNVLTNTIIYWSELR